MFRRALIAVELTTSLASISLGDAANIIDVLADALAS